MTLIRSKWNTIIYILCICHHNQSLWFSDFHHKVFRQTQTTRKYNQPPIIWFQKCLLFVFFVKEKRQDNGVIKLFRLWVCSFSPPGLPDVAGSKKPWVSDKRALYHPWEWWPAMASSRPAQRPRLPHAPNQQPLWWSWTGDEALQGKGGRAGDPQWEGEWTMRK